MIDPNRRYVVIDKNWEKGISFLDAKSAYWKQARNIDQSGVRAWNEAIRKDGKLVREATKEELAKLIAP